MLKEWQDYLIVKLTKSMAYETQRFNATFTRAINKSYQHLYMYISICPLKLLIEQKSQS